MTESAPPAPPPHSRRGAGLAAFAVCLGLAVGHTWPLATAPATLSRHDNADTTLNTWIVSWVAHQLPRDPRHLFDAPIFHPERRTLAYSEPLIVPGAMAVPLRAAGLDATTTYNLLAILGYALSAWAMWRLVEGWTGDAWAGAIAGAAYAFNAHLLTRFAHLQALHAEFLPLVLLAVDRLSRRAAWRDGWLLGSALALTGLTSIYQLAFAGGAAVIGLMARAGEWRPRAARTLGVAGMGLAAGGVLLAPVLWQYLAVSRELGMVRTLDAAAASAATWRDYLATAGRLHYAWWSAPLTTGTALFPGVTVLALAVVGLARGADRRRVAMAAAIAALGLVMSLGPALPTYGWIYDLVPLLQATRVTSRWGVLVLTGLAMLAGLGVAALRRTAAPARAVGLTALALVTAEAWRAPMAFTPTPAIPAVYRWVARQEHAVLLELPVFPGGQFNLNAPYLLAQTVHFRPMVAGYSGLSSPAYDARLRSLSSFPSDAAHAPLAALGVTHVVIHIPQLVDQYGAAAIDALDRVPWLSREFDDGEARVFRVAPIAP
ncbi:MAG: hypothetical protein R2708_09630 [Vicinamibacterales bacterium]